MPLKNLTISTTGDVDYSAGPSQTDSTNQWNPNLYRELFRRNVSILPQVQGSNSRWIVVSRNIGNQGTTSSRVTENYIDVLADRDITKQARDFLSKIENKTLASQAESILAIIQAEVIRLNPSIDLPPLVAFLGDDGAVLLEWIYPDFRIGFSLEVNEKDWGWYLASKPTAGGIVASGFLSGVNLRGLIAWLINFATLRPI